MHASNATKFSRDIQGLRNLIGNEDLANLCTVFGGKTLQISDSVPLRHQLNIIIGRVNAVKVISQFDGVEFSLPTHSALEMKRRYQAVMKDAQNGMNCGEIAEKYALPYGQVRRVIFGF